MKLRLVLKGPERMLGAEPERSMEDGSLIIGRSPDADWTISDPERVLSRAHCRIDKDFNGFVLTDTSTNGVRVNGEPVGYNLPRRLTDGDVILLGDAVLVAEIESAAQAANRNASEPATAPPADPPAGLDGPFGNDDVLAPAEPEILQEASEPKIDELAEPILDDWWRPQTPSKDKQKPKLVDNSTLEDEASVANTLGTK